MWQGRIGPWLTCLWGLALHSSASCPVLPLSRVSHCSWALPGGTPPSAPPALCLPAHLHFVDCVPGSALGILWVWIRLPFPALMCTGRDRDSDRIGGAVEVQKVSAVMLLQPTNSV